MNYKTISSADASRLIAFPYSMEFSAPLQNPNLKDSVYIGQTAQFGTHFFLEFESVVNPHLFLFGMSGSGKSYLLKSIMARLLGITEHRLLIIDFTGEYLEFAQLLSPSSKTFARTDRPFEHKLTYMNLSLKTESEKILIATEHLNSLLDQMRARGVAGHAKLFVLLDEAWKLLLGSEIIEVLIREGRKYGVGIVMASQLLGDVKEAFLSNVATVFAFRIQDGKSLELLQSAYSLTPELVASIQNLEQGSCVAIRVYKRGRADAFLIKRVAGVELSREFSFVMSGKMRFEITEKKFGEFLCSLRLPREDAQRVRNLFSKNYSMELHAFVSQLITMGVSREAVLAALRQLGIKDNYIADAFSIAVGSVK
ncbi:MAG: ATP-binding protein [Candidatus Micrarchaeota archaeon]|nr:ATP-binding protein [Candidatus Micrarchaeota archaeon]